MQVRLLCMHDIWGQLAVESKHLEYKTQARIPRIEASSFAISFVLLAALQAHVDIQRQTVLDAILLAIYEELTSGEPARATHMPCS